MEVTAAGDSLQMEWDGLLFGVRRSIRYHQRRRAFFDRLDQTSSMASVIFGSTAIYGIMEQGEAKALALIASALVTVLASVNLVVGSSRRAREHADLAKRFIELEKRMIGQPEQQRFAEVMEARLTIEAEEPPVLRVLDCMCHNEQMRAMGYGPDELAKIGPLQRLFAHIFDWREAKIHESLQSKAATPPS